MTIEIMRQILRNTTTNTVKDTIKYLYAYTTIIGATLHPPRYAMLRGLAGSLCRERMMWAVSFGLSVRRGIRLA